MFDIILYNTFCQSITWSTKALDLKLSAQVDVDECAYGLIGAFYGDFYECEWMNYYINYPIFDLHYDQFNQAGSWMDLTCNSHIAN
jgi:hypothetical protein